MGRWAGKQRRRRYYPVYAGAEAHYPAAGHLFQGEDAQEQPENGEDAPAVGKIAEAVPERSERLQPEDDGAV